jgi:hypothetical protein
MTGRRAGKENDEIKRREKEEQQEEIKQHVEKR